MLTHSSLYLNALSQVAAVARPPGAVGLLSAPMFHVGGMALSLQVMLRLGTQILLPAFDEVATLEAIQAERVTETFLVPTMIKRLIEHPRFGDYDLSSLRMMIYGAAPIDSTLLAQAMRAMPDVQFCQAYGMTEVSSTVALLPPACHVPGSDPARLRSAGLPVPIAEIRIVDGEDRELPRGAVGEITVRGPTVMSGYWNKPEQTAAALRGGWMHTGDSG
jgi:acyl-CoA synthetase (AMP-forming)/AMP-acid ligase II